MKKVKATEAAAVAGPAAHAKINFVENDLTTMPSSHAAENRVTQTKRGKNAALMAVALAVSIFCWQLYCEVNNVATSPGWALEYVRASVSEWWRWAGKWVAYASSYLQWLNVEVLWRTTVHLLKPLVGICFSWTYFFAGYVWAACEYYNNSFSIYVGTALPLALLLAMVVWKRGWRPFSWVFSRLSVNAVFRIVMAGVVVAFVGSATLANVYKNKN